MTMPFILIADEKIPFLECFKPYCDEIRLVPGEAINAEIIQEASMLLIRTVTRIDETLLKNSALKFIGSATTGIDHVDLNAVKKHHIFFADAAGANSEAVADYMTCLFSALKKEKKITEGMTIGIIGYGRIGKKVAEIALKMGFNIITYDPFVKNNYEADLTTLLKTADIITLHTPLTKDMLNATYHLLNHEKIDHLKKGAILINTARGGIIEETALAARPDLVLCFDVYEQEPNISRDLLSKLTIATPHIAGYSLSAKKRATDIIFQKAANYFGWPINISPSCDEKKNVADLTIESAINYYNPLTHTQIFKENLLSAENISAAFIVERKNYQFR